MCATAAHLTDRVIPDVPLRQWVLSVPYELRLLLARNADALSAVGRIFVQEKHGFAGPTEIPWPPYEEQSE